MPSWSYGTDTLNKLPFVLPMEDPHGVVLEKIFENGG